MSVHLPRTVFACLLHFHSEAYAAAQGHAWNEVKFGGDLDQNGLQKTYTVDLMHVPGSLYRSDMGLPDPGGIIPPDEEVARYQRKDIYQFISLTD